MRIRTGTLVCENTAVPPRMLRFLSIGSSFMVTTRQARRSALLPSQASGWPEKCNLSAEPPQSAQRGLGSALTTHQAGLPEIDQRVRVEG